MFKLKKYENILELIKIFKIDFNTSILDLVAKFIL